MLQETEESAKSERESLAEHVKSVENRALGDLDRARQESKVLQATLDSAVNRHTSKALEFDRGSYLGRREHHLGTPIAHAAPRHGL